MKARHRRVKLHAGRISRLAMAPGDVLVVQVPMEMCSDAARSRMISHVRSLLPEGARVLMVSDTVKLSVLAPSLMPVEIKVVARPPREAGQLGFLTEAEVADLENPSEAAGLAERLHGFHYGKAP